jgi:hypothetical protein
MGHLFLLRKIRETKFNIDKYLLNGKSYKSRGVFQNFLCQIPQSGIIQGQLQRWTEHFTLIFENLKPVEISKKNLTSFEHL